MVNWPYERPQAFDSREIEEAGLDSNMVAFAAGVEVPESHKSRIYLSKLLVVELEEKESLHRKGQSAVTRRGLVIPESLIRRLAIQMLLQSAFADRAPPTELVWLFVKLLRLEKQPAKKKYRDQEFTHAALVKANDPNIVIRAVAKKVGVAPNTISAWIKDEEFLTQSKMFRVRIEREADFEVMGRDYKAWL
jgi:hypothetical protein